MDSIDSVWVFFLPLSGWFCVCQLFSPAVLEIKATLSLQDKYIYNLSLNLSPIMLTRKDKYIYIYISVSISYNPN